LIGGRERVAPESIHDRYVNSFLVRMRRERKLPDRKKKWKENPPIEKSGRTVLVRTARLFQILLDWRIDGITKKSNHGN